MKIDSKFLLYQNKWIFRYIHLGLSILEVLTYVFATLLVLGFVYHHGFRVSYQELNKIHYLYKIVWFVFFLDITFHLLFDFRAAKRNYNIIMWLLTAFFYLTLLPVIFHRPDVEGFVLHIWDFFNSQPYRVTVMLVFALFRLSNGFIRFMSRRVNPSLILSLSFLLIILIGTGLFLLPRCTVNGISWDNALFLSTSSVCVTGLSPLDLPSTLTLPGFIVMAVLIQIGGLGVMTLTSFFAMFFMGNTSYYNQMAVRDMVNSDSMSTLINTLVHIFLFTITIEGLGMALIWYDVHGTMGMNLEEEIAFSAFHAVSSFCNAGFSTLSEGLGDARLMNGTHNALYFYIGCMVVLGGLGFPVLVNLRISLVQHIRQLWHWLRTGHWKERTLYHLFYLNTRLVLSTTLVLLLVSMACFGFFEWNASFAGLSTSEKLTQSFFMAASPRSSGFSSVSGAMWQVQTLLLFGLLMWIGGGSQSTAGGVKVNTVAVVVLNLMAVLRGQDRVEISGRELSDDSIRRANATVIASVILIFTCAFIFTILEPRLPLRAVLYETVAALSTAGYDLGIISQLGTPAKLLVIGMMFIGRVGVITVLIGIFPKRKSTHYRYPSGQIVIN